MRLPGRKYENLYIVSDDEAEKLLKGWTRAVEDWLKAGGLPNPMPPELLHDVTFLATAFSLAWVMGHMTKEFERDRVKLHAKGQ